MKVAWLDRENVLDRKQGSRKRPVVVMRDKLTAKKKHLVRLEEDVFYPFVSLTFTAADAVALIKALQLISPGFPMPVVFAQWKLVTWKLKKKKQKKKICATRIPRAVVWATFGLLGEAADTCPQTSRNISNAALHNSLNRTRRTTSFSLWSAVAFCVWCR